LAGTAVYDLQMHQNIVEIRHLTQAELEAGVEDIRRAPKDEGVLHLIVRRPNVDEREVLEMGELSVEHGLVGDTWKLRNSSRMRNGGPHPDMQLNIMNARAVALIAQDRSRWPLAGDQLFVDLDLTTENLPAWTKLQIGTAIIEVTDQPHTGCAKFVSRFGVDAMKFVNSPLGRSLNLRGINARVVQPGTIRAGDVVRKVSDRP
jgi:MOSC domain-containing protein YiiM